MKRSYRSGEEEEDERGDRDRDRGTESIIRANVLMRLSGGGVTGGGAEEKANLVEEKEEEERVFECKTCNRRFPTFQALGGHRASHKKPKLADDGHGGGAAAKPRVHECSICGIEFAIGQALGGHTRRHRAAVLAATKPAGERRGMLLDLNLPPLETDDLKAAIGIQTVDKIPVVDYCLYR